MSKKKRNNRTSFSAPHQKGFGDNVNHPKHYNSHPSGVECIAIVRHYNFNVGNVFKYLWRHGLKHEQGVNDRQKAIEDLRKAQFYLNDEIERLEHEAVEIDTERCRDGLHSVIFTCRDVAYKELNPDSIAVKEPKTSVKSEPCQNRKNK